MNRPRPERNSLLPLPQRNLNKNGGASADTQPPSGAAKSRSVSDLSSEDGQFDDDHSDENQLDDDQPDNGHSDDDGSDGDEPDDGHSDDNRCDEDQFHENQSGRSSEDQFYEQTAEDPCHSERERVLGEKASRQEVGPTETAAQPRKRRRQDSRRGSHAEGSHFTLPSPHRLTNGAVAGGAHVQETPQPSNAEQASLLPETEQAVHHQFVSPFEALVAAAALDNSSYGAVDPNLLLEPPLNETSAQSASLVHAEQRGDIGELLQPQLQFDTPNFGLGDNEQHSYFGEVMLSQPLDDFLGIPPDASEIGQFEHSSFDFVLQGTGIDPLFDMSFSSPESSL